MTRRMLRRDGRGWVNVMPITLNGSRPRPWHELLRALLMLSAFLGWATVAALWVDLIVRAWR